MINKGKIEEECSFCGELIEDEKVKCKKCGEFSEKAYHQRNTKSTINSKRLINSETTQGNQKITESDNETNVFINIQSFDVFRETYDKEQDRK